MKKNMCVLAALVCLLLSPSLSLAEDIYVDPSFTGTSNGTENAPWKDLVKQVYSKSLKGGDRILLKPGYYGHLSIYKKNNESEVQIISTVKHKAIFAKIDIRDSDYWTVDGVKVQLDKNTPEKARNLVDLETGSAHVRFINSYVSSSSNTEGWTPEEWNKKVKSGIFSRADPVDISHNDIRVVNDAITAMKGAATVVGNSISDFIGDGLRGLGSNSLYEGNIVKNCHKVSGNHLDGFQSWSMDGNWNVGVSVVKDVVLRGNIFIANETDQNSPKCDMQGIGMFDGMFENWVIENNIVVVDHWHGLSVYGAKNVKILNNTVFDPNRRKPGPAWIRLSNHKNGTKSQGNLVANNLASSFQFPDGGVLQLQNQIIRNPYAIFADPENQNYRLKEGARAIDAGMEGVGPKVDFYGNPRPSGEKIDVGAAEFQK